MNELKGTQVSSSAKSVARVAEMRAKRGARWLDENVPGWWKRINVRTLRLSDGESCICGQVFRREARKAWSLSGFTYASSHLFAEANSWVSTIVGPVGTYNRRRRVGVALGFVDGKVGGEGWWNLRFKSDRVKVSYDDLQNAWVKVVKERKAAVTA